MIPALERWTGDYAMTKNTTKAATVAADIMLFDNWFYPIEDGVRERVRGFIETMLEEELDGALSRPRYGRRKTPGGEDAVSPLVGFRHGHRKRALTGTFGKTEISVPRAWHNVGLSMLRPTPRKTGSRTLRDHNISSRF
jgi:transposase-like protein